MEANPHSVVPPEFPAADPILAESAADGAPLPAVAAPASPTPTSPAPGGLSAVFDIPVKVQAVLGGARMQVEELLQIGSGSVVELDRRVGEPIDLLVNNRLIARGELVLVDGSLGITLTEIVRQGER